MVGKEVEMVITWNTVTSVNSCEKNEYMKW